MPVELPVAARKIRTGLVRAHARATASSRVLPTFLIIGAQKGGTTSLHDHLSEHPAVGEPERKEVHYFTLNATRSVEWYRAHFPRAGEAEIVGEATPYYLFHPAAAQRAHAVVPDAHLIAMLRNPVDRAHSQHNHEVVLGYEQLEFEEALAREEERLAGEAERLAADPTAVSYSHQHHSYAARGRYAEQLERWFDVYGRERVHVMFSEDFFSDPAGETLRVQEFLGLSPQAPVELSPRNARQYSGIDADVRRRLAARFSDDNHRLARLIGRDLPWD